MNPGNHMKRREFLKTSLTASTLAGLGAAGLPATAGAAPDTSREYYELRAYRLKAGASHDLLEAYLERAAIPAWNRLGLGPIGIFSQQERKAPPTSTEVVDSSVIFALIPHPSLASFSTVGERLDADAEYQKIGAEYLATPKASPAFERIDSWLLLAFARMPKIEQPAYSREKKPRLLEMRTYESYSEVKALKKVAMFNDGEIQTMRETGLGPVFYGQTLIGPALPHLTYMLSAESEEAHQQHWADFKKHPVWNKLSNDPQYADTVSKITNRFLAPKPYSQI